MLASVRFAYGSSGNKGRVRGVGITGMVKGGQNT